MRWIVTLVAALCVASAGAGRIDELSTRDHHVATVTAAHTAIAATAHRRDARRDLPFVAAASPEIAAPARTASEAPPRCTDSVSDLERPAPCSRGPPRG